MHTHHKATQLHTSRQTLLYRHLHACVVTAAKLTFCSTMKALCAQLIANCVHLNATDLPLACGVLFDNPLPSNCMLMFGMLCLPDVMRFVIAARAPITDTSCLNATMPATHNTNTACITH